MWNSLTLKVLFDTMPLSTFQYKNNENTESNLRQKSTTQKSPLIPNKFGRYLSISLISFYLLIGEVPLLNAYSVGKQPAGSTRPD